MIQAVVRFRDGIGERSWLRTVVRHLQQALVNAGHPLEVDGRYGSGTRTASKVFQRAAGLEENGVFDRATWTALADHLPAAPAAIGENLPGFDGDLDWVHMQEGHAGRPYWPEGNSGVTLDPGVDLGHASEDLIEGLYGPLLTQTQMKALRRIYGFKGEDARTAINQSPVIQGIRITEEQSLEIMPYSAKPYWAGISDRFRALKRKDTPPSVETSLLSLAYNRGILNRHLASLGELLQDRRWDEAAQKIGSMQRGSTKGIRLRREREGALIEAELEFLAS